MVELFNEKERKIIRANEGFNSYRSWGGGGVWEFGKFSENG